MPAAPRATSAAGWGWGWGWGAAELLKREERGAEQELKGFRAAWMLPPRQAGLGRGSPGFLGGLICHPTLRSVPSASMAFAAFFCPDGRKTHFSLPQVSGVRRSQLAGSSDREFSHLPGGWHRVKGCVPPSRVTRTCFKPISSSKTKPSQTASGDYCLQFGVE